MVKGRSTDQRESFASSSKYAEVYNKGENPEFEATRVLFVRNIFLICSTDCEHNFKGRSMEILIVLIGQFVMEHNGLGVKSSMTASLT